MKGKFVLSLTILLLLSICVTCALTGNIRTPKTAPEVGNKLRQIELQIPESENWELDSVGAILCTSPQASMLAGVYDALEWPSDDPKWPHPSGGLHADPVDGRISLKIPPAIWDKIWARTDLVIDYRLPTKDKFPTSSFHAYYYLPSGCDRSEMSVSFDSQQITLKPNIKINGMSPDEFAKQIGGVFIDSDLLLDVSTPPASPLFNGFSLDSPKPLEEFDGNIRNLPIFKRLPNASGLFSIAMGVDLKSAERNPRHNNTYSATFLIGDDEASITEDGTLTASISVHQLPVEVLTPEDMRDEIFDVWAAAPFKYYTNSTQVMSSNVRITSRKPGVLYVQECVEYEFLITRHPWIKPERRMIFVGSKLPKIVFDMRGFRSDRVKKKSNNRPLFWTPRDRPRPWADQDEVKSSEKE